MSDEYLLTMALLLLQGKSTPVSKKELINLIKERLDDN